MHDENVEYLKTKKLTIEMLGKNAPTIPHQSRWGIIEEIIPPKRRTKNDRRL